MTRLGGLPVAHLLRLGGACARVAARHCSAWPAVIAIAGALIGGSGCAVAPATLPPQAAWAAPATWARTLPQAREPVAQGWQAFGDALLIELIDAAAAANSDVASAQANLRRARALREQSNALLAPSLGASARAQRNEPAQGSAGELFELGFDASWEVDVFGQNRHGLAAAQADERASAAALAAVQATVAAEVALSYLQARGGEERLRIVEGNLAAHEQTLNLAEHRHRAGLTTAADAERARSALAQVRAQRAALAGDVARHRHALAVLTGGSVAAMDAALRPAAALPAAPAALVVLDTPLATLERRPDVREAQEQLLAALDRLGQERAARHANPRLSASLGWSALTLGSLGSGGAGAALLASLAQPLFDGGQRDARIAAQQASVDVAQAKLQGRVANALREVEDALAQLGAAQERIAALEDATRSEQRAVDLVRHRYSAGLADALALLDAQRTLLQVQDQWVLARLDHSLAHVRLYKALGGGWTPPAPTPTPAAQATLSPPVSPAPTLR